MRALMLLMLIFFNSTIINNKTLMTTNYQKYVNDRLNLSVGGADL